MIDLEFPLTPDRSLSPLDSPTIETDYRCPRTGRPLVHITLDDGHELLETRDRSARYPIEHGVPNFRLTPTPDPEDEARLQRLGDRVALEGWRTAITRTQPELLQYIDDPSRAMFLDQLPLNKEATALEIGPGLGQLLVPIAQRVKAAYALELSPGQARFALLRAQQSGCSNAHVATGCDDLLLPYADHIFDVVVLNHVLEWARMPGETVCTVEAQKILLREIERVLVPGGTLWISTKNRFGLRLLLGGRDEHMGDIPFGQALPRKLSYKLAQGRPGLRGLLHSYTELEAILREVGLHPDRSLWGAPDSRYPAAYVPTDTASVRKAQRERRFAQGPTRSTRALMPLVPAALVKYVTPGLTFVAHTASRNDRVERTYDL